MKQTKNKELKEERYKDLRVFISYVYEQSEKKFYYFEMQQSNKI